MNDNIVIQQQAVGQIKQIVIDECKDIISADYIDLAMDMRNSDENMLSLILMIRCVDNTIVQKCCSFMYPPVDTLEVIAQAISDVVKKQVRAEKVI